MTGPDRRRTSGRTAPARAGLLAPSGRHRPARRAAPQARKTPGRPRRTRPRQPSTARPVPSIRRALGPPLLIWPRRSLWSQASTTLRCPRRLPLSTPPCSAGPSWRFNPAADTLPGSTIPHGSFGPSRHSSTETDGVRSDHGTASSRPRWSARRSPRSYRRHDYQWCPVHPRSQCAPSLSWGVRSGFPWW